MPPNFHVAVMLNVKHMFDPIRVLGRKVRLIDDDCVMRQHHACRAQRVNVADKNVGPLLVGAEGFREVRFPGDRFAVED